MANNSFPSRLREARIAKGVSQTELAHLADLAPGQVNRYEAGKNKPRPHVIGRLAGALGVHPAWLDAGEGPIETGSTTAYGKRLDVTSTASKDGGMQVEFAFDDDVHRFYVEAAEKAGIPLEEYLKQALIELAADLSAQRKALTSQDYISEIAKQVKELIAAENASDQKK